METTFTIEVPYVIAGEGEGVKVRLLTQAERSGYETRAGELEAEGREGQAAALRAMLAADAEVASGEGVHRWTLLVHTPSHKDDIVIQAIGARECRDYCRDVGVEPDNDILRVLTQEAQARILIRDITDDAGASVGKWEAVPDDWKSGVAQLVDVAVHLSEEERVPLFGPRPA